MPPVLRNTEIPHAAIDDSRGADGPAGRPRGLDRHLHAPSRRRVRRDRSGARHLAPARPAHP
ncbi:hypothetical protein PLANTIT3_60693 [Plantibacter sp. T3]|nr:hypothetical protein PLANTIT3_60693 [Plantibacter sp. T3]